jgi:hypothetical protein
LKLPNIKFYDDEICLLAIKYAAKILIMMSFTLGIVHILVKTIFGMCAQSHRHRLAHVVISTIK